MAPHLFLLVMEHLSRTMHLMALSPGFDCHPRCKRVKIVQLSFIDDLVIFSKGNAWSIENMQKTLERFASASGLNMNKDTIALFYGGLSHEDSSKLASI